MCTEFWPDPIMGDVYFGVAHLTLCYVFPLMIIALCYAMVCKRIWCRQIPGEDHRRRHRPAIKDSPPPENEGTVNSTKTEAPSSSVRQPHSYVLHRARLRALRMLAIVVAAFAIAWLPLYLTFARLKFFAGTISDDELEFWKVMIPIAQWMGSANSCVNPVLYHFLDPRFRIGFRQLLICAPAARRGTGGDLTAPGSRLRIPTPGESVPRLRAPITVNFTKRSPSGGGGGRGISSNNDVNHHEMKVLGPLASAAQRREGSGEEKSSVARSAQHHQEWI